ncbi:sensor histidine kinase [Pseudomonas sp. NCCP-436]|uniref:sensor histidine kinase n=1 Tax=Pseudomonas sp. NCCP-436 TaxID=2842481 RepID=UPI001C7FBA12|nr:sensor histidine kinase [Pseudomonas sp. NCCP-436]GIZ13956.1 hypothetical protein NCCP436_33720 [Pseudomonas sp. NCCP-436]
MSRCARLSLTACLLWLLACMAGGAWLLRQAGTQLQAELQMAEVTLEQLGELAGANPGSLNPALTGSLRHIRVQWLQPGERGDEPADGLFRQWITDQLLGSSLLLADSWRLDDGRELRIALDPSARVEEICATLRLWLLLATCSLGLALLTIRLASGHRRESRLQVERDELIRTLLKLQGHERKRLGQALHDDLGQYLSAIRAQSCLLRLSCVEPQQIAVVALQLEESCEQLQQGFRRLIRDLYPLQLEQLDIGPALQQLVADWEKVQNIRCRLQLGAGLPVLPLASKSQLYRLVQEALTNVARHARASEVRIRLQRRGRHLRLLVRDNGRGLCQPLHPGVGLRSMRERSRSLGADLRLSSRPGAGCLISLSIPLEATQ